MHGIGTYCRTTAIDIFVDRFLSGDNGKPESGGGGGGEKKKQIISLGAGTDTRYWRLRKQGKTTDLVYHEFDFPDVARLKHAIVRKNTVLQQDDKEVLFEESSEDGDPEWGFRGKPSQSQIDTAGGEVEELNYIFHPLDLRSVPSTPLSTLKGIYNNIPTLLISECCLCYFPTSTAHSIIQVFSEGIPDLGIILYEPIGPNDAFGQMMKQNLKARGLSMPTVAVYEDLDAQKKRLRSEGFDSKEEVTGGAQAIDIEGVWERWVGQDEKERVDALEGLDEVEEWIVLARHYAIVWGWRGGGFDGWENVR